MKAKSKAIPSGINIALATTKKAIKTAVDTSAKNEFWNDNFIVLLT